MGEREKEYRRFAEECMGMAVQAQDETTRDLFMLMAQVWHRIAREIEEATDASEIKDAPDEPATS